MSVVLATDRPLAGGSSIGAAQQALASAAAQYASAETSLTPKDKRAIAPALAALGSAHRLHTILSHLRHPVLIEAARTIGEEQLQVAASRLQGVVKQVPVARAMLGNLPAVNVVTPLQRPPADSSSMHQNLCMLFDACAEHRGAFAALVDFAIRTTETARSLSATELRKAALYFGVVPDYSLPLLKYFEEGSWRGFELPKLIEKIQWNSYTLDCSALRQLVNDNPDIQALLPRREDSVLPVAKKFCLSYKDDLLDLVAREPRIANGEEFEFSDTVRAIRPGFTVTFSHLVLLGIFDKDSIRGPYRLSQGGAEVLRTIPELCAPLDSFSGRARSEEAVPQVVLPLGDTSALPVASSEIISPSVSAEDAARDRRVLEELALLRFSAADIPPNTAQALAVGALSDLGAEKIRESLCRLAQQGYLRFEDGRAYQRQTLDDLALSMADDPDFVRRLPQSVELMPTTADEANAPKAEIVAALLQFFAERRWDIQGMQTALATDPANATEQDQGILVARLLQVESLLQQSKIGEDEIREYLTKPKILEGMLGATFENFAKFVESLGTLMRDNPGQSLQSDRLTPQDIAVHIESIRANGQHREHLANRGRVDDAKIWEIVDALPQEIDGREYPRHNLAVMLVKGFRGRDGWIGINGKGVKEEDVYHRTDRHMTRLFPALVAESRKSFYILKNLGLIARSRSEPELVVLSFVGGLPEGVAGDHPLYPALLIAGRYLQELQDLAVGKRK